MFTGSKPLGCVRIIYFAGKYVFGSGGAGTINLAGRFWVQDLFLFFVNYCWKVF